MSEVEASPLFNPQTTFHVHEVNSDGSLGEYVGGASDLGAACAIAAGVYVAIQGYNPSAQRLVTIRDDAGADVAFVGAHPVQAGLPEE